MQRWCNEKGDITCEICHEVGIVFFFFFLIYLLHSQQHATLLLLYLLTLDPIPVLPSSMQLTLFSVLENCLLQSSRTAASPFLFHYSFWYQVPLVTRKLSFKKFPASLQTLLVFCIQFRTLVSYLTLKP